jgi:hypothetical protein
VARDLLWLLGDSTNYKKGDILMKARNLLQSLAVLTSLISSSAFSDFAPVTFKPESTRLIPQNTFLPSGFDDNDNVQLVVSGYLPNTCYKAGVATAQVDQKEKKIYIQNTAYIYGGSWCAPVTVPYMHTVNLGFVPAGRYQILIQDQQNKSHDQGFLNVAVSTTAAADDYLYAPVQDVFVESPDHSQPPTSHPTLVIRGMFESDCMHLQEVKVNYRSPNIIEIFPIASMDEKDCHAVSTPFESHVKLQGVPSGSTLIYVRSLNGQAISKVINL